MGELAAAVIHLQQAMEQNGMSGKFELRLYLEDIKKLQYIASCAGAFETPTVEDISIYGHKCEVLFAKGEKKS
jgi:hypothetical protein